MPIDTGVTPNHVVREAVDDDLQALLDLYLHLHERSIPDDTERLHEAWRAILGDPNHHVVVCEVAGRIVSSCVCVVIPNLTRGVRPYAFVENVVTDAAYRGRGYASACLDYAREIARGCDCYKMMLLTGSRDPATHAFYEHAGYNSADKTAYIQWL